MFRFKDMEKHLMRIADDNPEFVKLSVEGMTEEGRSLYLMKIGRSPLGDDTRAVFIDGGTQNKCI